MDSLLFLDTNQSNGILNIISIKSKKSYGAILDKGRANGEFLYGINLTLYTTFEHYKDSLFANFYDFVTGRLYRINFTKQILDGKHHMQELFMTKELPRSAFWAKTAGDTLVYLKTIEDIETQQIRSIITKNGQKSTHITDKLSKFQIPAREDFNIISSVIAYSQSNNMFVEAMTGMNYLNVYSIFEEKGYTLCIGKELDKLTDILAISRPERKYSFADVRAYNFGFAVLKYDIDEKAYQTNADFYPSILLFDWSGNPIGEIESKLKFNHFDIDTKNGCLYILDKDGRLLKKECDILKRLKTDIMNS